MGTGQGNTENSGRSKRCLTPAALIAGLLIGSAAPVLALEILPLSEVKPGMKGYGLTVIKGQTAERFEVEVLGVMPNATPARAGILVQVSGLGLEESGVSAGMSGSPVFLDGKLAGAVAAAWGFSKKPIGLVTPIEAMRAIDTMPGGGVGYPGTLPRPRPASVAPAALLQALSQPEEERLGSLEKLFQEMLPPRPTYTSSLAPCLTGIPAESLARFAEPLARLGLTGLDRLATAMSSLPGTLGGAPPLKDEPGTLVAGSAFTALLIDGDLRLGATGTVTEILPDGHFLGFGHPFLNFGELELPVARASVITVLSSYFQSFKIAYALKPQYRLVKDRDVGVSGVMDRPPRMIPVRFRIKTEEGEKTLNWVVAPQPKLLPLLVALSADAALSGSDPTPRDRTLRYRVAFETSAGSIAYEDQSTGFRARDIALLTAATLAGSLADNEFEDPQFKGIDLSFETSGGERRLKLLGAALADRRVAPGEDVVATVRVVDWRGAESSRVVRVTVPRETPIGRASLFIADGSATSAARLALEPAEPRTLADLARMLSRFVPSNALVASVIVPSRGAATGTQTLTALPPTIAARLGGSVTKGEVNARLVSDQTVSVGSPLSGSVRLDFEVERPRS